MPCSRALAAVDSGRRLHTATISTPARARNPGMCRSRVLAPAPIRPTRRGCSAMVSSADESRARLASRPQSGLIVAWECSYLPLLQAIGRNVMRQLITAAVVAVAGLGLTAAAQAAKVEVKGVHLCCGACERAAKAIL